ncbi:hypothetical protein LSAT2_016628 [Lamellibrachia satsuma]|nr:hypothetical protein LSAT2_016628 [Lamellibrachia satsuma]
MIGQHTCSQYLIKRFVALRSHRHKEPESRGQPDSVSTASGLVSGFKKLINHRVYDGEVSFLPSGCAESHPQDNTWCKARCTLCQTTGTVQNAVWKKDQGDTSVFAEGDAASVNLQFSESATAVASDWNVIRGQFLAINSFLMSCRCHLSRNGVSPTAHLGDGCADLILIRPCSRIQFLQHLYRCMLGNGSFDFPFVDVFRVKAFKFRPFVEDLDDTHFEHGCCSNGVQELRSEASRNSVWNCDGEILSCSTLQFRVHRQVIQLFARGIEDTEGRLLSRHRNFLQGCCRDTGTSSRVAVTTQELPPGLLSRHRNFLQGCCHDTGTSYRVAVTTQELPPGLLSRHRNFLQGCCHDTGTSSRVAVTTQELPPGLLSRHRNFLQGCCHDTGTSSRVAVTTQELPPGLLSRHRNFLQGCCHDTGTSSRVAVTTQELPPGLLSRHRNFLKGCCHDTGTSSRVAVTTQELPPGLLSRHRNFLQGCCHDTGTSSRVAVTTQELPPGLLSRHRNFLQGCCHDTGTSSRVAVTTQELPPGLLSQHRNFLKGCCHNTGTSSRVAVTTQELPPGLLSRHRNFLQGCCHDTGTSSRVAVTTQELPPGLLSRHRNFLQGCCHSTTTACIIRTKNNLELYTKLHAHDLCFDKNISVWATWMNGCTC